MQTTNNLFSKFQPMIFNRIYAFKKYSIINFEDLYEVGLESFVIASSKYDKQKSSFSTYLYKVLTTNIKNYIKIESRRIHEEYNETIDFNNNEIKKEHEKTNSISFLNDDSKNILEYLISFSWYSPGLNRKPSYQSIKKYMKENYQWSYSKTLKVLLSIKEWWNKEE